MFWLGFLFGDENRNLKELEQHKKDHQAELDNKTIGFMVETLTPQLEFMKKNELDNLTFPILDLSKFDFSLLSKALTKCGSKIAYTRLEKENGTFNWTSTGSKSIGLYSSQEVAQSVVENKEKDGFKATMVVHSPLELPL